MTITLFSPDELLLFFFLTARIGAIVFTLPFLGSRIVPFPLKILLIFLLSLGLYPVVQGQGIRFAPAPLGVLGLLLLGEVLLGITIGMVVQILFAAVRFGGEVFSHQIGLSIANIFDPQQEQQSSLIGQFLYILSVLLFFTLRAHHWFIYAMAESLHKIPLLGIITPWAVRQALLPLMGRLFIIAIQIGAPVLVVSLLSILSMGIIARLVPQINIFILSLPVSLSIGLMVLGLALPYLFGQMQALFGQLGRELFLVIQLMETR
ncbi:MAG: flagellar biosynthetic protein FliR [Nitrospinota bacterium]|nr:MAG: flagellar biosynthetic protein FliR [Nitrospinota bacterium]